MVDKIWIRQFRNLDETVVSLPGDRPVFVLGQNNQGKTNFLEALYCLGHVDSPRPGQFSRMVRLGEDVLSLGADVVNSSGTKDRIYIKIFSDGRREVMVNDVKISRRNQLAKLFPVQYLSADVIELMQGYSDARRRDLSRFCDMKYVTFSHDYKHYQGVVKQKRQLLKQGASKSDLELWNARLSQCAVPIVNTWLAALNELSEVVLLYAQKLPRLSVANVKFEFVPKRIEGPIIDGNEYGQKLTSKLQDGIFKEQRSGMVLYGPHTDDYRVLVNGMDLHHYYSRGINRIFSILIKLAQLKLIKGVGGSMPILLLDDVLAEVDDEMRRAVMTIVSQESQVVYTSTNEWDQNLFDGPTLVKVENGQVCYEGT